MANQGHLRISLK